MIIETMMIEIMKMMIEMMIEIMKMMIGII